MFVILLGPPGAGKGTQADLLAAQLGVPKISTGELFREQIALGTGLGKYVAQYIDRGVYVPDQTTMEVLARRLDQPDAAAGAVFDGFPRTIPQAEALDRLLTERERRVDRVIDVRVPEDELLSRLAGRWTCLRCHATYHTVNAPPRVRGVCDRCGGELFQRTDDSAEAVGTRLKVYRERTQPLIEYYRRAGILTAVDGAQPKQDVTRALVSALDGTRAGN